jgi:hypothetical protein
LKAVLKVMVLVVSGYLKSMPRTTNHSGQ